MGRTPRGRDLRPADDSENGLTPRLAGYTGRRFGTFNLGCDVRDADDVKADAEFGVWADDNDQELFAEAADRLSKSAAAEMLGWELLALAASQSAWSQKTFGTDAERGPVGALRHMQKECDETIEAITELQRMAYLKDPHAHMQAQKVAEEFGDILLLWLDAGRRAGFKPIDVVLAAKAKMVVNKTRVYQKTPDGVPSEHVRDGEKKGRWFTGVVQSFAGLGRWFLGRKELLYLLASLLYVLGVCLWLFGLTR
jgi:NTP pyrophosphatase (non-canonical NTP hydrolase)